MILTPQRYKELYTTATQKSEREIADAINAVTLAYIRPWVGQSFFDALVSRPDGCELLYQGDTLFCGWESIVASLTTAYMQFLAVQATRLGAVVKKGQYSTSPTVQEVLNDVSRRRKVARMQASFFAQTWWPRAKSTMPPAIADIPLNEVFEKEEKILGEFSL